jgi:hypothetical protein
MTRFVIWIGEAERWVFRAFQSRDFPWEGALAIKDDKAVREGRNDGVIWEA